MHRSLAEIGRNAGVQREELEGSHLSSDFFFFKHALISAAEWAASDISDPDACNSIN